MSSSPVPALLPSALLDFFSVFTKLLTSFNLFLSTPIYLSILLFLYRRRNKKPFDSSFFTLFIVLGVVDLSKYWLYVLKKCSYWQWVPPVFRPLDQPNFLAALLYFSHWSLTFCQLQLNLLLSLNRFISILFPHLFRRFWTRPLTLALLLAFFAISLALAVPILWLPICFRSATILLDDNSTMTKLTGPVFMNNSDLGTYYGFTKSFVWVILAVCLIGYPLMCFRVRKLNIKDDRAQAVEVRMFYALFLLLIANLLYASYILIWDYLSKTRMDLAHYAEWCLYVIVDFYDMNTPYGLLITSSKIRKNIFPFNLSFKRAFAVLLGRDQQAVQPLQHHNSNRVFQLVPQTRQNAISDFLSTRTPVASRNNLNNHLPRAL